MKNASWAVKIRFISLFVLIVALFIPLTALAEITGYIKNIDGVGINGAMISAIGPGGDATATTVAGADGKAGYYSLPLAGGGYDITITVFGYRDTRGYYKYKSTRDYYLEMTPVQEYFVNPHEGSPDNAGTKEAPFKTLEDAQGAIQDIRESGWTGVVEVYLRGKADLFDGIYYRENSFVLTDDDSGTVAAPVVYKAYPGEEVRIVGGVKLDWGNFTEVTDANILSRLEENVRSKVRQINLRTIGFAKADFGALKRRSVDQYYGRDLSGNRIVFTETGIYPPPGPMELFIDQEPGQLARWPDKRIDNNDLVQTPPTTVETVDNKIYFTNPEDQEYAAKHERLVKWSTALDPWFQGFWKANYIDMQSGGTINTEDDSIQLDVEVTSVNDEGVSETEENKFEIGERFFYVKNLLEEITQEGEWYLERKTGILYLYPYTSEKDTVLFESMETKEIMVSTLGESLLVLKGTSNIHFENITFEMSRGELVSVHNDDRETADVDDDIVSTDNLFYHCVFRNSYYAGAVVYGKRNKFDRSTIANTGDMGVWLVGGDLVSLTRGNNEISNSKIFKTSRWRMSFVPGIRIKGMGQIISHNELYDMPGSAIFGGSVENLIEYNDIHNVLHYGKDVAAIYLGGGYHRRGNKIQFNHFHDIQSNIMGAHTEINVEGDKTAYFSFGIYIDDVHSGATVKGNVFSNIAGAALYHGGGRDNTMENNIMVNCGAAFWTDNRGMDRVISPHECNDGDTQCAKALVGTYDMFLATQLNTGDFVHTKTPWLETYPKLAAMPTTWEEVRDGDWRQPEGNTFARNIGVVRAVDDSIYYFAKSEKVHPDDLDTLGRDLRGFTYPLNYFSGIVSTRYPEETLVDFAERVRLEFVNDKNKFDYLAIDLAPASGMISIPDSGFLFEGIPIGQIGTY